MNRPAFTANQSQFTMNRPAFAANQSRFTVNRGRRPPQLWAGKPGSQDFLRRKVSAYEGDGRGGQGA